jgi:hypothetical protein
MDKRYYLGMLQSVDSDLDIFDGFIKKSEIERAGPLGCDRNRRNLAMLCTEHQGPYP